jgi:hypothetical protein
MRFYAVNGMQNHQKQILLSYSIFPERDFCFISFPYARQIPIKNEMYLPFRMFTEKNADETEASTPEGGCVYNE